ncbi:MAG: hypothetical protein LBC75_01050 [Fibromonadaceae bacterium]|jgi:prophage antirepressor-like protein|nr:hypothetical protein [Fibromonadaceae bacterium]
MIKTGNAEARKKFEKSAGKLNTKMSEAFKDAAEKKEADGTLPAVISAQLPAIVKSGAEELAPLRMFFTTSVIRHHFDGSDHWFCAADLAKEFEYPSVEYALKKHCIEDAHSFKPDGSTKPLLYVSEADCYNWALRSGSLRAMPFRRLVTQKILPKIREFSKFKTEEGEKEFLKSEGVVAKDVQLELFPETVKLDFKNFSQIHNCLKNCRAWLAKQGKEFPAHDDYLRYLLQEGMKNVGFGG